MTDTTVHRSPSLAFVPAPRSGRHHVGIIPMSLRTVHFVLPGGVDDPATPSGGNAYDRRVSLDLPGFGWQVRPHPVHGDWPRPGARARTE
ncbi:glycosyltransferase family 1 protein, partial [Streptomyces spiralis]